MAIPMNHVFWFVVLALCLMHLDKSLGGSVVRPHIWALHFWTCHLLGSIHSGWSKLSFKAWWYLVKSATSLFPTIFTCWLWAVGLSEGGILQLMLQSKLLLTTPPLQPPTFSMKCNDVVKPSTILVPAFMSDLRSTWICTHLGSGHTANTPYPAPKIRCCPVEKTSTAADAMNVSIDRGLQKPQAWLVIWTICWFSSQLVIDIANWYLPFS